MTFKEDWKGQLVGCLVLFCVIPLFIILAIPFVLVAGICQLFRIPKDKKQYKASRYYADVKRKFRSSLLYAPQYRFYNAAMRRGLPINYVRQDSNRLEYFIYRDTLYLFPEFEELWLDDEGVHWQVWTGETIDFDAYFDRLLKKLDEGVRGEYPVKLLVERKRVQTFNLNETPPPEVVFVTRKYEKAFETEEDDLIAVLPKNTKELYEKMLQTPDLCGSLELLNNGELLVWRLYENVQLEICVDSQDSYICAVEVLSGKGRREITHWHPDGVIEIYDEILNIGKRGNVLVLRSSGGSGSVLYMGSIEDCPYPPDKRVWFGKYYFLKAI